MRVVIAEDSVLLREGVARRAARRPASTSWAVLRDGRRPDAEGAKLLARRRDRRHPAPADPQDEGLRAALEIRAQHPDVGVLVLSQYVEVGLALKLFAETAEGAGYLLKDRIGDVHDFVAAVRRIAEGGSAIDPIIVSTLLSRRRDDDPLPRSPRASARCSC